MHIFVLQKINIKDEYRPRGGTAIYGLYGYVPL